MSAWTRLLDSWDRNWKGKSFDGRNLKEELLAHPARDAVSDRNLEEYTVWGVALHVHRYKEWILSELEGRAPSWPEGDDDFPPIPEEGLTEPHWLETIDQMDQTHEALLAKARALDEAFLETIFTPWEITWGEVLTWAAGHDGYHTAQIRNMKR